MSISGSEFVEMFVGVGVGAGVYFFAMKQQVAVQANVATQQKSAQKNADAYRKKQEDMMKQLEQ
jgi:uncharacterized membrane protein YgaE (UPF0421/DUF939 family)